MKKSMGFLISLAALILIAYYVMGFIAESTLTKNVNSLQQSPIISIHLKQYQRGWFSSQATLVTEIHIPQQTTTDKNGAPKIDPPMNFDATIPLTITHGPFIFTEYGLRFGIGHATTSPQTHFSVLVNYFNKTLLRYALPSFNIKGTIGPNDFQLQWLGLSALLSASPNLDQLEGNSTLYGLSGSSSNISFKMKEVVQEFKFTSKEDGLLLGHLHCSLPSLIVSVADKTTFELDALNVTLGSDITDGGLNFYSDISLNKLFVQDKTYGPGIIKLSIKNLDPVEMAKLQKLQLDLLQANQTDKISTLALLLTEWPKLFSQGPMLELSEMKVHLPEGIVQGYLKISLPKANSSSSDILKKAWGEGRFSAPTELVRTLMTASIQSDLEKQAANATQTQPAQPDQTESTVATTAVEPKPTDLHTQAQNQADKTLQEYVSKGLLKVETNDYVIVFKLENEKFTVNGVVVDSSSFNN